MSLPSPPILQSCVVGRERKKDRFLAEHLLVCVVSGTVQFHLATGTHCYGPGQVVLVRKNQLVHDVQLPLPTGEQPRVLNVWLRQEDLRRYAAAHAVAPTGAYHGPSLVEVAPNAFFASYFESLRPYLGNTDQLTGYLVEVKITEAVELLLRFRPALRGLLFDFGVPHKLDLESFMVQHYAFNVPLGQFAWLTGRSLATFKRDFHRTFGLAPQKWLLRQRLVQAHYLLAERQQKPSAVYLAVGFENFSHFCFAFRQQFGYPPSRAGEPLSTGCLSR